MSINEMAGLIIDDLLGTCEVDGCTERAITTVMEPRGNRRWIPQALCLEHAADRQEEAA